MLNSQQWRAGELTMGCSPARAAPTARPQKPASVMGVSMTRLGPKRSNRPLVTLYLYEELVQRRDPSDNGQSMGNGVAYAPLYCATSSPKMKVLWLLSSSSASASFSASRTVTSLVPVSVAYPRKRRIEGAHAVWEKAGRRGAEERREESRRAAGRKSRGAAMVGTVGYKKQEKETRRSRRSYRAVGNCS